jgi:hypothetical protein
VNARTTPRTTPRAGVPAADPFDGLAGDTETTETTFR